MLLLNLHLGRYLRRFLSDWLLHELSVRIGDQGLELQGLFFKIKGVLQHRAEQAVELKPIPCFHCQVLAVDEVLYFITKTVEGPTRPPCADYVL